MFYSIVSCSGCLTFQPLFPAFISSIPFSLENQSAIHPANLPTCQPTSQPTNQLISLNLLKVSDILNFISDNRDIWQYVPGILLSAFREPAITD